MSSLSQSEERLLSGLQSDVEILKQNDRGVSREHAGKDDGAVRLFITQAAHGFTRRTAVCLDGSTWRLLTPYDVDKLWGVIEKTVGANRFSVIIAGEARVGVAVLPGYRYTFVAGVPTLVTYFAGTHPMGGLDYVAANATDASHINVDNGFSIDGPASHGATWEVVTVADTFIEGAIIAYDTASSHPVGALADSTDLPHSTPIGVLAQEVGTAGAGFKSFLMLTSGSAQITFAGASGAVSTGAVRDYLSDVTPGLRTGTKPAFPIFVGRFSNSYDALSGYTTLSIYFPGVGCAEPVPYPLPAEYGGVGADLSLIDEHSVLAIKIVDTKKRVFGYFNTGAVGFLSQNGAAPFWTIPSLGTGKSFEIDGTTLYARVCGTRTAESAPSTKYQFLKYDTDTGAWIAFSWVAGTPTTGRMLQIDTAATSGFAEVVSETACSVLGRAANSAGVVAAIASSADGQVLQRLSGVLTWTTLDYSVISTGKTTGKWVLGTNSSGVATWVTEEDARDNIDLQNLKCFRTASLADVVVYGANDPVAGTVVISRLSFKDSVTEPTSTSGVVVLVQRERLCSHFYFGSAVATTFPNNVLFKSLVAMDFGIILQGFYGIVAWAGYSLGSNSVTYATDSVVRSPAMYADHMYPADGYSGTVNVRNSTNTGAIAMTFTNGILTGAV